MSYSLTRKYDLNQNDLVVDLGSNDGTLLTGFKKNGTKTVGVEPTNIANIANKNNIETIQEFFTTDVADNIKNDSLTIHDIKLRSGVLPD